MNYRFPFRIFTAALILLACLLAWLLWRSHDSAVQRTINNADNLAQALEGQFSATLRRIEADLRQVAPLLPDAALDLKAVDLYRRQVVERILRPQLNEFPEVNGFYVWATDGGLLYSTRPVLAGQARPSIAARPGFLQLREDPQARISFSESIRSTITGEQTVAVYLPLRDRQGRLRGVLTATLNLAKYAQDFERLQLAAGSVVYIRRSDNHRLVIRHPPPEGEGNPPVVNAIQRRIDAGEMRGRERFRAVTDGEFRLYGFRRLDAYPFYVVVGMAERMALVEWRRNALLVGASLLLLFVAIGGGFWRARRVEAEREVARQQAARAHALLQEAIDSLSAGMIIYDAQDRFVTCNQALRQIFARVTDTFDVKLTFEEIMREGLRRGMFPAAQGQEEAWLAVRLQRHRVADGQPYEMELDSGEWVQFSEYRTASGYTVGTRIDITERKRLERELRRQASTDALTALPNRRYFLQRLEEELERVRRGVTQEACVLMLDLDHFKRINDHYGHAAGDEVLRHFANLLRQELRGTDTVGRIGGEEFAAILPGSSASAAQLWAQRICDCLADKPLLIAGQPLRTTVSVGVTTIQAADLSADSVLSRADKALYQAKQGGRNRVELAPGLAA